MLEIANNVLWPPPYYLLRDRIPFVLTGFYIWRDRFPVHLQNFGGWVLYITTFALVGATTILWKSGLNMEPLLGFRWHLASPMEWGAFILLTSTVLYWRGLRIFDAYYLCFMAGLGGGWLYEILYGIPYWVQSGFAYWNIFKVNAAKVFFIEYQVISLPLLWYFLQEKHYAPRPLLGGLFLLMFLFYWFGPTHIMIPFNQLTNPNAYGWLLRIPCMIFLGYVLMGVKGEK